MTSPHTLDFLRIPFAVLAGLDNRGLHYALQPYHHLIRLAHILAMGGFFGGLVLLDLRLMGMRATLPFKPFAAFVLPVLYVAFTIAVASGGCCSPYDPVAVGSHAYFVPKLILIGLGVLNAALYHRMGLAAALAAAGALPRSAFVAGALSLAVWSGVVTCAALNAEAAPKVRLR